MVEEAQLEELGHSVARYAVWCRRRALLSLVHGVGVGNPLPPCSAQERVLLSHDLLKCVCIYL